MLLTVIPVQKLCLHQGLTYKLSGARTLSSYLSANHLPDCQHYRNKSPKKVYMWTNTLGILFSVCLTQLSILLRIQGHSHKAHTQIYTKYICTQIRQATALTKCKHFEKEKKKNPTSSKKDVKKENLIKLEGNFFKTSRRGSRDKDVIPRVGGGMQLLNFSESSPTRGKFHTESKQLEK